MNPTFRTLRGAGQPDCDEVAATIGQTALPNAGRSVQKFVIDLGWGTLPLDGLGSPCYAGPRLSRRYPRWVNRRLAYFRGRWTC